MDSVNSAFSIGSAFLPPSSGFTFGGRLAALRGTRIAAERALTTSPGPRQRDRKIVEEKSSFAVSDTMVAPWPSIVAARWCSASMSFFALLVEALLVFVKQPLPVARGGAIIETLVTIIDDILSHIMKGACPAGGCLLTVIAGKVVGPLKSIIIGEMD